MTTSIQAAFDNHIQKLQLLRDLLSDPEIAETARRILSQPNGAVVAAISASVRTTPTPRKYARKMKRGALAKKALEIVKTSTSPLSAKDVAEAMEQNGFTFKAGDKYVSVSKALRSLAKQQKIVDKRGDRPKSAIHYTRLPSLVPVQERTH